MGREISIRLALIAGAALALTAATQQPPTLAQVQPGEWELTGVPGAKAPVRQCVSDIMTLSRFEHRSKTCSQGTLNQHGSSAIVDYRCGAAGFGRSELDVITPRSLRISTQGISDNLPFNYVLQARRVGDCSVSAQRH